MIEIYLNKEFKFFCEKENLVEFLDLLNDVSEREIEIMLRKNNYQKIYYLDNSLTSSLHWFIDNFLLISEKM